MTEKMNIYEKLQLARVKLQMLGTKKSGENKYKTADGKIISFSYYELSDFLPQINEIFAELKMFSCISINKDNAVLTVINSEIPDEKIAFSSHVADVEVRGCGKVQGIGALHTYMRRYLYMLALEIVENDFLDAVAGKNEDKKVYETPKKHIVTEEEKEISKITTVDEINNVYKKYSADEENNNWQEPLKTKCRELKAKYDKTSNVFVQQ